MNSPAREAVNQKEAAAKTQLLQDKLATVQKDLESYQLKIDNAKTVLEDNAELLKTQQKEHKKWLADKQSQSESISQEIKTARKKLKSVKDNITERQQYLHKQETDVATAIELFNTRLREAQADMAAIERQKDDKLQELADLNEQISAETSKSLELSKRAEQLTKLYEENVAKYKTELRSLQVQIDQATMNKKKLLDDARITLERLSDKEKELKIREQVLDEREATQAEESAYLRKKRAFIEQV